MTNAPDARLEDFRKLFWGEVRSGKRRLLQEYRALFPGLDAQIAEEYERAVGSDQPTQAYEDKNGAASLPPVHIGRYRIVRYLGHGGMGVVYLGQDPELDRSVVLKTVRHLHPGSDARLLERLEREARIGSRLNHDGICAVHDIVRQGSQVYLVMPFIEGVILSERMRRSLRSGEGPGARGFWRRLVNPLPEDSVARASDTGDSHQSTGRTAALHAVLHIVEKVARSAHLAHEAGVVHRDLKPQNVMIRSNGDPVILDFGLALDISTATGDRLSHEGDLLGTLAYMAPEQIDGRLDIDRRADVYALGVMLYELLTTALPGRPQTRHSRIIPPRRLNRSIPRDLECVCMTALEADRGQRYATALLLADDLRNVRTLQPTLAKPLNPLQRLARAMHRHPWTSGAVSTSALLGLLLLVFFSVQQRNAKRREELAPLILKVNNGDSHSLADSEWDLLHVSPEVRALLLENPNGLIDYIVKLIQETRSGQLHLRSPRATILEGLPVFRFDNAAPGSHYAFELHRGNERIFDEKLDASPDGTATFVPPQPLELGEYRWRVQLDASRHNPEEVAEDRPVEAAFRIASPDELDRILGETTRTGITAFDTWRLAESLLEHGFAREAQQQMDRVSEEALAAFPAPLYWSHLRAWSHALLGEQTEAVEELRAMSDLGRR